MLESSHGREEHLGGNSRETSSHHTTTEIVSGEDGGSNLGVRLSEVEEDALEAEVDTGELREREIRG